MFNRRSQQSRETAEQYIMALYDLAENCEYGDLKAEMIRDRLVVGIQDDALSHCKPTRSSRSKRRRQRYDKRKQYASSSKPSKEQKVPRIPSVASMRSATSDRELVVILAVEADKRRESPKTERSVAAVAENAIQGISVLQKTQCHNCRRIGHYSAMCRQKTVSSMIEQDNPDSAFLDTLSNDNKSVWISNVGVNGKEIPFKLDTGAEVTAVSKETWKALGEPTLQQTDKHLFGPVQQRLPVLGKLSCHLSHKGQHSALSLCSGWSQKQLARPPSHHSFAPGSENRLPSNSAHR
jgi:hypothetical protein